MKPLEICDISHYESQNVSFHDMAAGGVPAVIFKATQGAGYVDPTYEALAARARSVPLIVGAYAFLNPGDARPQVDHFLETAQLQSGDLQPIIDAEAKGLSKATVVAAMSLLEQKGYKPLLYASLSFWRDVLGSPTRWPLWLAAYTSALPKLPAAVRLWGWQYTEAGKCPGIPGTCDMTRFYGTVDDLKKSLIP